MKTIEEKIKEMMAVGRFDVFCWQGELPEQIFRPCGKYVEYALAEKAVEQVAREVRKELTKWHDPKKEVPPLYDNVMVKYTISDGCEHIAMAWRSAGDAGGYTYAISGTGVTINSRDILGWREIHENL